MKLLLTGVPGVGKTTVIQRILKEGGLRAGGFYTQEMREGGRRVGFLIKGLDGREAVLAHVDFKRGPRVGKYRVDLKAFEEIALGTVEQALKERRLVIMDEIGKMELFSSAFRGLVLKVLESDADLLGVITKASDPFVEEIRRREGVEIWEVTYGNRADLPAKIIERLKG